MISRRGVNIKMMLSGLFVISLLQLTSAVKIKLNANESIATLLEYDGLIFFQPEEPPASPMSCSEQSPCDGCGSEMVCGGSLPLDLSAGGDTLRFVWAAPENKTIHITGDYTMEASGAGGDSGWITQGGDFGTEVELRLDTPNCKAEYQDIDIKTDVTIDFDDGGIGHTQSYQLLKNTMDSFVELRAGCAIYMRMRFEPTNDGILDLKFQKLTISALYDIQKAAQGEREYTWSTSSYIWIREPADGSIKLESTGVPTTTVSPTTTSFTFASTTDGTTVSPTTTSAAFTFTSTTVSTTVSPTTTSATFTSTTDSTTVSPTTTSATFTSTTDSTIDPAEPAATTITTTTASTTVPPTSTSAESGSVLESTPAPTPLPTASPVSSSPQSLNTIVSSLFLILALLVAAM